MQLKPYLLVFFIIASLHIVSCGQTGDLYLPENEIPQKEKQAESEAKKSKN